MEIDMGEAMWIGQGRRRVAVVTGSRADYGHLRHIMRHLADSPGIELQVVVCGMHLAPQFGTTWREIERDGFRIDARVDLQLAGDTPVATVKSTGLGMIGFADAFSRLAPELLVLLGDRYEMLAAGAAGALLGIPITHLHGGELTYGAFDDAVRHALTKLAHLHFVAAEPYRARVIQMGEDPTRVFNVGTPGLDNMDAGLAWSRMATLEALELPSDARYLLVTLHPATADHASDLPTANALVEALAAARPLHIVLTGVNADPGHGTVEAALAGLAAAHPERVRRFMSLGSERYFAALHHAEAAVGNSSSGIVEAPAVGTPTVNIGSRQAGRLRAASIIDCGPDADAIAVAIKAAVAPAARPAAAGQALPYGGRGASARVVEILRSLSAALLAPKRFHDVLPDFPVRAGT